MRNTFLAVCAAVLLTFAPAAAARADTLWVTTLEAVLGLDPVTLEIRRTIPLRKELSGALHLLPTPDNRTVYLLSGGREVVSALDLVEGKVTASWSLSERMGEDPDAPRIANARFSGIAIDHAGKRIVGNIVTSRRSGTNPHQLERIGVDAPYLAVLDAATGKRLATISGAPWATSFIEAMRDPAHPNRFLVISPDLDIIDLDRLPAGKAPVRATFEQVRVKHVPLREPYMAGQGPVVILTEWFHPEPSGGLGSTPYYTTDPIVEKDQMGVVTMDLVTSKVDVLELGPVQGPQYAFSTVVAPDRRRAYSVFNQLHEIDLMKRKITRIKDLPYTYYGANMSPDGKLLYIFSGGARLARIDPESLDIVKEVELPSEAWDILTLPD
ncbi:MAG: hypothetical protein FJZ01_09815 [Candidatus Sericytochromatia bacterium]|nr:hypothetical protein [Candidatus Tanganyikabacteria bacterium]